MHALVGRRFGRLMIVEKTRRKDKWDRCYLWRCRCDCGRLKLTTSTMLQNGQVRSCGCLQTESRKRDFTGRRVGSLVAIRPTSKIEHHSTVWLWQCDCGRRIKASLDNVLYSGRRSCGCRNLVIKRAQAVAMQEHCQRVDGTDLSRILNNTRPSNNTSGRVGVSYNSISKKWYARIQFRGVTHWLGAYGSKAVAVRARTEAEEKYFKSFLRSR